MTFDEFNIDETLLDAISYMHFEKASPIQEKAIPVALEGRDVLACAQTGTGKTATFLLPILQDLVKNGAHGTTSLVIVPTRELAIQIDQESLQCYLLFQVLYLLLPKVFRILQIQIAKLFMVETKGKIGTNKKKRLPRGQMSL